ncbi:MAG: DUF3325 family protein [Pseudomonadota bacterium]
MSGLVSIGLLICASGLCLSGCLLLALSQRRNWRVVLSDRAASPPNVASAGWLLVFLALVPCTVRDGGSFAALVWPLLFASAALATAMTLAYRPTWLKPVAYVLDKGS